ncbi:MAG: redoxin domain-containing protein [Gemmatimonadales bacterium]|nr:redoxin domain-containing protein [Gemmatimonadales bacterium]NIN13537.1 redoxin domain-containing protein [Gemmatimonadales bacterium]NIN51531.1 redoxin domain-containing protein [Gemmatimonadales bacterium]NIP08995.1 redoxin domain-containing protein [Gemmatimonadales bacterium]NIR03773.1 redoxin domain-containing protein [Gemmatimonadales bacterium]
MRDDIEQYRAADVQPFGVNPASVEDHERYANKLKLPFPLLSDPDREASGAYGALKTDGKRIQRSVVLVDRDGRVIFAARGAPRANEILAVLR